VTVEADNKLVELALPGFKSREEIRREKVRENARKYYTANREKKLEAQRKYYTANPEKKLEAQRKYYAANQEKARENARKYYTANPEKVRENARKWRAENREKKLGYSRKYRAANREKVREAQRKWTAANPEKVREIALKRRYGLTNAEYNEFLVRQNHVCALCQKPEKAKQNGKIKALAVDHCHETAEKYGAEHSIRGLLCSLCNKALARATADRQWWKRVVQYLSGFERTRDLRIGVIKT
jgi:hypothetical protein